MMEISMATSAKAFRTIADSTNEIAANTKTKEEDSFN